MEVLFKFNWLKAITINIKIMIQKLVNILLVEDDEVDVMNVKRAFSKTISRMNFVVGNVEALDMLRVTRSFLCQE
jgi:ActR/RegA family two-component response regulator